jgi:predicted dienelactone hydrolase
MNELTRLKMRGNWRIFFALVLLLAFLQILGLRTAQSFQFDGADGSYHYEVIDDIAISDPARNRQIPLRIYAPRASGLISPVILVSHGIGGSKASGNWVGKFLASHGYVCIFMTHYGSDTSLLDSTGGLQENIKRLQDSLKDPRNTINRPLDVTRVLDWLEQTGSTLPALKGRIDLKRIGLTGHSFGGFTTLASAGGYAQVSRKQFGRTFSDPRPRAFLAMSPPGPRPGADPSPMFKEITRPSLIMTGSNDLDPIVKPPRSAESRLEPYKFMPPGDKYALWIEGAYHHTFGDGRAGQVIDPFHRKISRIVCLAFFDAYLKGNEPARDFLASGQIEKIGGGQVKFYQK